MIMASTCRRELETVLVKKPRWKHGNIGFIDPAEPLMMRNGRQHYLIHWDNPRYIDEYVDCLYMHKMEDILKSKCTWYSPGEVWVSPEQCELAAIRRQVAVKGLRKSRALGSRLFKESNDTLELSIDPFAEVLPEETLQAAQKRSPKPLPQERLQAEQKRSPKPLPQERQQAAQKRSPKPLPQERLQAAQKRSPKPLPKERVQAVKKRSPQVGEEDVRHQSHSRKEGRNLQHCKKNLNNLVRGGG